MYYEIVFTRHDIALVLIYTILAICALILFAVRRKIRWFRNLTNNHTWMTRKYIGETTLFPTYRRRDRHVWIRKWEKKPCYIRDSGCTMERGRYPGYLEHDTPEQDKELMQEEFA